MQGRRGRLNAHALSNIETKPATKILTSSRIFWKIEKWRRGGKIENGIPLRPPTPRFHVTENGRNGPLVVLQPVLRRGKGGSTIRMVKVLRRRGRSGGAHIEGREGAACPDALCPDNDDDGDHHDGHHVAEVPAPSWIPVSACR